MCRILIETDFETLSRINQLSLALYVKIQKFIGRGDMQKSYGGRPFHDIAIENMFLVSR